MYNADMAKHRCSLDYQNKYRTMELKEYLQQPYQGGESFINTVVIPIFGKDLFEDGYDEDMLESHPEHLKLAQQTSIKSIIRLGTIQIPFNETNIFDITVADKVQMGHNRVAIQLLVRSMMSTYSSAFMIFHYDDDEKWDWRFTFCNKGDNRTDMTESKRYTFLLGPNQSCRTAADNFQKLFNKHGNIKLKDIEEAFDVEALSKEFFGKYKEHYEQFVEYITGKRFVKEKDKWVEKQTHEPQAKIYADFGSDDKCVRDYVKKLLGRIVFLHFLQKKGWMGVPANKAWGEGDQQFMFNLFNKATESQKDNFLDEVLEPLFSEALDTNRAENNDLFNTRTLGILKVPYLNGGLFVRDKLDEVQTKFPKELFEDLFNFFHQYNFTIDENDPNDAQVGVDPEMLGRIFENLLEDNKDKGAFYTPKEIVQYMCRESLISYLQTDEKKRDYNIIANFVRTHITDELTDDIKERLDKKLCDVKICDPAIGSGAFPMGLLRELFLCRGAIKNFNNAADIKKHIIQNNIYGVDIERGAVDIARLRFWLSLVVDEKTPHSLPNLDFKIMQGNSLLESYQGVDLSKLTYQNIGKESVCQMTFFDNETDIERRSLSNIINKYYDCADRSQKKEIMNQIVSNVNKQIELQNYSVDLSVLDIATNDQFFLWHTWFSDVFNRPSKCGFDIVIGNPPYGAKYDKQTKRYYQNTYITAKSIRGIQKASLDTYTLFIELGYNLLRKDGSFAYIVPISLTSSDSLTGVHRILMGNCNTGYISSYAVRPKPVFENAVVNTSILLFQKTKTPCQHLFSTKMHRRGNGFDLQKLIENLQFVEVNEFTMFGRIPKIGTSIEKNILAKVFKQHRLQTFLDTKGKPIYYRTTGGRYFKVVTNYPTGSTKEKPLFFEKKLTNAIGCVLSSSLAFWFYQIYSNNLDWKTYEIENFTIPQLSPDNVESLEKLYSRYLIDIEANANIRSTSGESTYNVESFKEYKIVRSKAIIDEIDDYLCPLYGLTREEIDFIKNYELEFRLAGE